MSSVDLASPAGAVLARLFLRIQNLTGPEGEWNGGDVVEVVEMAFQEAGVDPEQPLREQTASTPGS